MDWLPLIAAGVTGVVAIVGVWWSISAANNRESERGKKDRLTLAASNYLEMSREVTDEIYKYMQFLNKLGSASPSATQVTLETPSQFGAYRRLAALQGALDQLVVVCPEALYAHAANVFTEHNKSMMTLNKIERSNKFDGDFELVWYYPKNPGEPMQNQLNELMKHIDKVTALNRHFATQIRAELGLLPINSIPVQTEAP